MKNRSKSNIAICIILSMAGIINSQSLFWKHVITDRSFGTVVIENAQGEYVFGHEIDGISTNTMLADDGEIKDNSVICHCENGIVFLAKISEDRILNIAANGRVLISDSSGARIEELDQLSFGGSIVDGTLNGNILSLIGEIRGQYEIATTKHLIDLTTLKIIYEKKFTGVRPPLSHDYFQDGSSAELYYPNANDSARLVIKNPNDSILESRYINSLNTVFNDLTITSTDEIFAIGSLQTPSGPLPISSVLVKCSKEGKELWRKVFERSSDSSDGILLFNIIKQAPDGSITVVGSDGIVETFRPLVIYNFDTDGNLNWKIKEQIFWDGEEPKDLIFTGQDEFVIAGTSGQTDYLGPERAFVAKFSSVLSRVENIQETTLDIYPNPFDRSFNIHQLERSHNYKITDINGVLIQSGNTQGPIDMVGKSPGMYFLSINGFRPTKILKQE